MIAVEASTNGWRKISFGLEGLLKGRSTVADGGCSQRDTTPVARDGQPRENRDYSQ